MLKVIILQHHGKLDDKELFYMMSRGIDKKEATKLLVKAKLNKIIENIKDENIRKLINDTVDNKLK